MIKNIFYLLLIFVNIHFILCQDYSCENTTYEISCPEGEIIHVLDAFYGRNNETNATECGRNGNNTEYCSLDTATDIVMERCNRRENCTIYVNETTFEDPCPGTIKFLTVNYTCSNKTDHHPIQCGSHEHPARDVCDCIDRCSNRGFEICPLICRENGCICDYGYRRDPNTQQCVLSDLCPQPGIPLFNHEIFSECASRQRTCMFPWSKPFIRCEPGYMCIRGYLRDFHTGQCVRPAECPRGFRRW